MPPPRTPISRKTVGFVVKGIPETSAALSLWGLIVRNEFNKNRAEVEKIVMDSIQKILATGKSKTANFEPIHGMTKTLREIAGNNSNDLFVGGRGHLARNIIVTSESTRAAGEVGHARVLFGVNARVGPAALKQGRALIFGHSQVVTPKIRKKLMFLGLHHRVPKVGHVLITPPRDFLTAGIRDVADEIKASFRKSVNGANARVTAAIPIIPPENAVQPGNVPNSLGDNVARTASNIFTGADFLQLAGLAAVGAGVVASQISSIAGRYWR